MISNCSATYTFFPAEEGRRRHPLRSLNEGDGRRVTQPCQRCSNRGYTKLLQASDARVNANVAYRAAVERRDENSGDRRPAFVSMLNLRELQLAKVLDFNIFFGLMICKHHLF